MVSKTTFSTQPSLLYGLSEEEVRLRRTQGQGNNVKLPTSRSYGQILRENILTLIHCILFALSGVLLLLGRPLDAITTVSVISFNILVGVFQEIRAKRALDRIALLARPTATVIRAGHEQTVDPGALVVGDLLVVRPGDQIVVDGLLVGEGWIDVDESLLTGESEPVRKSAGDSVSSGSFCVNGSAVFEAVQVGVQSTAYQLTAGARTFRRMLTPLQRQVSMVIRILLVLACYLGLALLMTTTIKQTPLLVTVQMAVVIAGLIPNGLLLAIAVAYGLAAVRLAGKGVLIQQANAVESLSTVTVLCCDKTGTLTANRLYIHAVQPFGTSEDELGILLGTYAASVSVSNATTSALASAYAAEAQPLSAEVPFSSTTKWSALTLAGTKKTYVLGAPEMLEPFLQSGSNLDQVSVLTEQGLRVLLFACYDEPVDLYDAAGQPRLQSGLIPLGLVSIGDTLRTEARQTLATFRQAGVQLKVISGDNPDTVAALAKQVGLAPELTSVSGLDLAQMKPAQFAQVVRDTTVFGRITPQQKECIVQELHAQGAYVAMVGDGINDVLSLKRADLGIAMQSGSQMTRSAADIVLLDDSFAALPRAVQEGQRVVNGMQQILTLFLTRVSLFTLFILLIPGFPFSPRQSSLITLLTVGIPTVALAAWAHPGPMQGNKSLLRLMHFVLPAILTASLMTLFVFLIAVALVASRGLPEAAVIATARSTITVFATVCGILLVVFVAPPPTRLFAGGTVPSGDWRPAILAAVLLGGLIALLSIPVGRAVFEIGTLPLFDVATIASVALVWMLLLRFAWRFRLLECVLGMESEEGLSFHQE